MATYAGFITHADEQIGRLVAHLKQAGQYDNTVFVVLSDNGAAPEGGQTGGFRRSYRDTTPIADIARDLNLMGGPETQPLYQRPWAMAGVTPFRRYKLWPYAGGVRTPLIISWARGIRRGGAVRSNYVDAIDIAPTLVDVAGASFHGTIAGEWQIPIAGRSIRATFTSATAPTRKVQFFELRGNRAITAGDWKAVAVHQPDTDFRRDRWELFNVKTDFAEVDDLSLRNPKKLEELKRLWWSEARLYSDPPLTEASQPVRGYGLYNDAFPRDRTDAQPTTRSP